MKTQKAFTLVELIVVIAILAILWTIATITLFGYTQWSRDTARLNDLSEIPKVLELYKIENWEFPSPSWWVKIEYTWTEVWTQWIFWEDIIKKLRDLSSSEFTDPLTEKEYTYSRLNTWKEFELASIMETDDYVQKFNLIDQSYAWDKEAKVIIKWNYNWQVASVKQWNTTYILAVPTIISWDISLTDIEDQVAQKKLIYNWYKNLPSNYKDSNYNATWEIDLTLVNDWELVVFSWSIDDLEIEANQLAFINNLQDAYNWTTIETESDIEDIVYYDSLNTEGLIFMAQTIINNEVNSNIEIIANNKENPDLTCATWTVWTYNPDWYYIVDRAELDNVIAWNVSWVTVSDVCTTQVTNMGGLFMNMTNFNEDINNFDTSNVTNMNSMFYFAEAFNKPIDNWDTSNVITMSRMFGYAKSFNQPVNHFNTSKVSTMWNLFSSSISFDQPIDNWDTSNVTNMAGMFGNARIFNQSLDNFNTVKVTNMSNMFYLTYYFNQSLNSFNTLNVTNMQSMFGGARDFDQPLDNFDTTWVTNIKYMFNSTYNFDQSLSHFNITNINDMSGIFDWAKVFNQNLSTWWSPNSDLVTACLDFDKNSTVWEEVNKPTFTNCTY